MVEGVGGGRDRGLPPGCGLDRPVTSRPSAVTWSETQTFDSEQNALRACIRTVWALEREGSVYSMQANISRELAVRLPHSLSAYPVI